VLSREAPDRGRPPEPVAGALKRLTLILALAAGLIAGCGSEDGATTGDAPTAGPSDGGDTQFVVTLDPDGKGGDPALEQIVTCPGSGKEACDAIAALPPDPAAEVPPDTACTEIYGGPDTLSLQGKINGKLVNARLSRGNGCEIERFERFVPMLEALFPDYAPGQALGA
jgi:hypothetical protein